SATDLAGLLNKIADQTISGKIAKEVFDAMWKGEGSAEIIIEKLKVRTSSESVTSAEFNSLIDSINNYSFMRNAK
ncbi:MAG: hypothetical protein P8R36_01570, partial [Actinomycetota bacterium]|nr:hypothetical protein [Actinomycetota bacterium]